MGEIQERINQLIEKLDNKTITDDEKIILENNLRQLRELNITLTTQQITTIRNKLKGIKWNVNDWVSADCDIKQCDEQNKNLH